MKFTRPCLILAVVIVLSGRLTAQVPPPAGPSASTASATVAGPLIQVDNPNFDFGKASVGEKIRHIYIVTNGGNQSLNITNVHPGCHCTTAGDWTHKIAPGQAGQIPVQFDSTGFNGKITRTIDVYSNARNEPRKTLTLTGTIWKPIEVMPPMANIVVPPDATNDVTTTVRIVNQTDNPVTVSNPVSANSLFTPTLKEITPGKEYQLVIAVHPPFSGNISGTITVNTSLPSTPTLNVTVLGRIEQAIQVYPSQIPMNMVSDGWRTNQITIHANTTKDLVLSNPKASDPRIQAEVQTMGPKGTFKLLVAIPPGYQLEPGQRAEVTVESSYPSYPLIRVPLVGYATRRPAPTLAPHINPPPSNTTALIHPSPGPVAAHN